MEIDLLRGGKKGFSPNTFNREDRRREEKPFLYNVRGPIILPVTRDTILVMGKVMVITRLSYYLQCKLGMGFESSELK